MLIYLVLKGVKDRGSYLAEVIRDLGKMLEMLWGSSKDEGLDNELQELLVERGGSFRSFGRQFQGKDFRIG